MRKINGKVADDSVIIEYHQLQIGWGYDSVSDLFYYLYRITGDDILLVQGNLWSTSRLSKNSWGGYKRFF